MVLCFTEPTIYRRVDSALSGPTLMIHQVDEIMCSAASLTNNMVVLEGIAKKVPLKILEGLTSLLYKTDIEQTALYMKAYAASYIKSCLLKLGWDAASKESPTMVTMNPATLKEIAKLQWSTKRVSPLY
jgi:hypothetical protein